jgi:hypothetical protein
MRNAGNAIAIIVALLGRAGNSRFSRSGLHYPKNFFTMKRFLLLFISVAALASAAESPIRVFIRSGPKSHAPGAHDYPRFLAEWVPLLNARGAKATGASGFPTAQQLAETDVLK